MMGYVKRRRETQKLRALLTKAAKWGTLWWAGHVALLGERKRAESMLVGKSLWSSHLEEVEVRSHGSYGCGSWSSVVLEPSCSVTLGQVKSPVAPFAMYRACVPNIGHGQIET